MIILVTGCNIRFVGHDEFYGVNSEDETTLITNSDKKVEDGSFVGATEYLRLKAYYAAEFYVEDKMDYEWGGDDEIIIPEYTRGIDCSGFIINVYEFAVEDTYYNMPFVDATANNIYVNYSEAVETPQKGDLIFWYDQTQKLIYHIALFEREFNGRYYFIDSTSTESGSINGVTYRSASISSVYDVRRFTLTDNNS